MANQPLADITNPQTRLAEFELRVRKGSASEVRRTLLEAMADTYPPLRHQAAIAVADLAAPDHLGETFESMLRALAVGDPTTAVELAEPLGLAPDDVPAPVATVRQAACRALRTSSNDATREVLLQAAGDDAPDVRYQALVSLHELQASGEAFEEVVVRRVEDEDPEVAVVAAQIASQRGWSHTVPRLIERWQEFTGPDRLQFALSLAELAGEHDAKVDPAVMTEVVDQLIAALEDETTIAAASQALVQLGSKRAVEALDDVVNRWLAHPILKVEAAGALHQLGDAKGSAHLEKSLNSSRRDARGYALRLVGRLRIGEFFDTLSRVAQSDDYHADTAVLALADYGGDEARAVLEQVAESHGDEDVRKLAANALQT